MVARVGRVDRDDRQVPEVLALAQLLPCDGLGLLQHAFREDVRDAELVDRDQREAARLERVAEPLGHARRHARRAADLFGEDEVADLRLAAVGNGEVAALLLLDALEPISPALLMQHAEHQLAALHELLHRVGDPAFSGLFGSRKHPVANAERALPRALDAKPRLGRVGLPALWHRPGLAAVVDVDNAEHRHLGHAAHLVEGAAGRAVDQPLVGHVAKQRLKRHLVRAVQPEGARDLALARGCIGRGDEVENLLAGRQSGGSFRLGHIRRLVLTFSSCQRRLASMLIPQRALTLHGPQLSLG